MTSLDPQLWELLETHEMPDDASGKPFIQQLMDEHGISRDTADVAITEYRKFMYLCATRAERNVPSQAVDLVWHLHMQHSRDYWDVFCKKLGKPVHHNPGSPDRTHLDDYKATIAAYRALFGNPPRGIWRKNGLGNWLSVLIAIPVLLSFAIPLLFASLGALANWHWAFFVPAAFAIMLLLQILEHIYALTPKGEFTLVFENSDPFADEDAGDCGSEDGGGCGD